MSQRFGQYWLLLFWAGFAALVLDGGRNPGFVMNPEHVAYPLRRVILETIMLAVLTMWLRRLLCRSSLRWATRGLESLALAAVLLFLGSAILVTDQPGDAYGVAYFAGAALIVLLLGLGYRIARGRVQSSPSGPAV